MKTHFNTNFKSWMLLDFAACFMFCVFAPLDAFFSNESEYWFQLRHLVPVVLTVFVAVFSAFALCSLAICRTRLNAALYSLCVAILLFFYIQGNFIPRPYGVLNGVDIDWAAEKYRKLTFLSIAFATMALVAWLATLSMRSARKNIFSVGRCICLALLGIQILSMVALTLKYRMSQESFGNRTIAVTYDKWLEFSPSNNVIMVMLDSFDGRDMNTIINGEEERFVRDSLRDFTYYPDTLGLYPTTKCALPHILTGITYTNELPYKEYIEKAYIGNPLYLEMKRLGYSACAYVSHSRYVNSRGSIFENFHETRYSLASPFSFVKTLYRMVAFNYLPHPMKKGLVVTANDFMPFRRLVSHSSKPYFFGTQKVYQNLCNSEAVLGDNANVFRFYHLYGSHPPPVFGKDLVSDPGRKYTSADQSLGCITFLREFLGKLKKIGVYDSSTIIVLADHGQKLYFQNPIFLVKNRGESHAFTISDSRFSYCWLYKLLLNLVAHGEAITESAIKECDDGGPRRFLFYSWDNTMNRKYLPRMDEMLLRAGTASLANNAQLEKTGLSYDAAKNKMSFESYELGSEISFDKKHEMEIKKYLSGFSIAEQQYTWTDGKEALIKLRLEKKFHNLRLDLDCSTFNGEQRVSLFANDLLIANYKAFAREKRSFIIPGWCVGKNGELTLRFSLPDAISPEEVAHNGDIRVLALKFFSVWLSADEHSLEYEYELGTPLYFSLANGASANHYFIKGLSHAEKTFTWTLGNKVAARFVIPREKGCNRQLKLVYQTFLPEERVSISVNGGNIADYVARGKETKTFEIPAAFVSSNGVVELEFDLPDAVSPNELNKSADKRSLALRLFELSIK